MTVASIRASINYATELITNLPVGPVGRGDPILGLSLLIGSDIDTGTLCRSHYLELWLQEETVLY